MRGRKSDAPKLPGSLPSAANLWLTFVQRNIVQRNPTFAKAAHLWVAGHGCPAFLASSPRRGALPVDIGCRRNAFGRRYRHRMSFIVDSETDRSRGDRASMVCLAARLRHVVWPYALPPT